MAQLDELYRETILEHNRNPRHFGTLMPPCEHLQGFNALCGDKVDLYLRWHNEQLTALQFSGVGCALSQASASMLCEHLQGASRDHFLALFAELQAALGLAWQGDGEMDRPTLDGLPPSLAALAGARRFPSRIKCVLLPWETLVESVQGELAPLTSGDLGSAPIADS